MSDPITSNQIARLVADYNNDATTLTAAETLKAISDVLCSAEVLTCGVRGWFTADDLREAGQHWGSTSESANVAL